MLPYLQQQRDQVDRQMQELQNSRQQIIVQRRARLAQLVQNGLLGKGSNDWLESSAQEIALWEGLDLQDDILALLDDESILIQLLAGRILYLNKHYQIDETVLTRMQQADHSVANSLWHALAVRQPEALIPDMLNWLDQLPQSPRRWELTAAVVDWLLPRFDQSHHWRERQILGDYRFTLEHQSLDQMSEEDISALLGWMIWTQPETAEQTSFLNKVFKQYADVRVVKLRCLEWLGLRQDWQGILQILPPEIVAQPSQQFWQALAAQQLNHPLAPSLIEQLPPLQDTVIKAPGALAGLRISQGVESVRTDKAFFLLPIFQTWLNSNHPEKMAQIALPYHPAEPRLIFSAQAMFDLDHAYRLARFVWAIDPSGYSPERPLLARLARENVEKFQQRANQFIEQGSQATGRIYDLLLREWYFRDEHNASLRLIDKLYSDRKPDREAMVARIIPTLIAVGQHDRALSFLLSVSGSRDSRRIRDAFDTLLFQHKALRYRGWPGVGKVEIAVMRLAQVVWHQDQVMWQEFRQATLPSQLAWLQPLLNHPTGDQALPNAQALRALLRPRLAELSAQPIWHPVIHRLFRATAQSEFLTVKPPPVQDWQLSEEQMTALQQWWSERWSILRPP